MELDELRIRPSGDRPSGNSPVQHSRWTGHVDEGSLTMSPCEKIKVFRKN